jgi:chemotaxis protein CheX
MNMDVELVNPFIDATLHVLETMASTKAQAGKPYLKKDQVARGDVSSVIGLTGEATGMMSLTFTEKGILPIVSNMFGEEMKEINDEIKDAVGEIGNMISGQARQKLEERGRSLKAAIPTVIMGKNHSITRVTTAPVIAIPFSTDSGEFTIEVCFEE